MRRTTLNKIQAREVLREVVIRHMDAMLAAQIAHAKGLSYLVTREKKTGKFVRVTSAMARLEDGLESVEIWEKDPSVQAFTDLMDRALDKAANNTELNVNGKVSIEIKVPWLPATQAPKLLKA